MDVVKARTVSMTVYEAKLICCRTAIYLGLAVRYPENIEFGRIWASWYKFGWVWDEFETSLGRVGRRILAYVNLYNIIDPF